MTRMFSSRTRPMFGMDAIFEANRGGTRSASVLRDQFVNGPGGATRPDRIIGGRLVSGDAPDSEVNAAIDARNEANAESDAARAVYGRTGVPGAIPDTPQTRSPAENRRREGLRGTSLLSRPFSRAAMEQDDSGFMYGGKVKKVKQPGYKNSGRVKIPGQDCSMGYAMSGAIGPEVTKWAGEDKKKNKKGLRGYAKSGKIGNKTEDDGRDSVEVRTREGEYLLNPETVTYMGGGDYANGVRMLDDTVRTATGQEPGPVPVNEDGEAMRGFRNGGRMKMGYNRGGSYANVQGERVVYPDPAELARQRGATVTQRMNPAFTQDVDLRGMGRRAAAAGQRALASPITAGAARWAGRGTAAVAPVVEALNTARVAADEDSTGLDVATQAASGVGRLASAGTGAALGSAFGPVGTLLGGAAGYVLGDRLIKGGRALLGTETADPSQVMARDGMRTAPATVMPTDEEPVTVDNTTGAVTPNQPGVESQPAGDYQRAFTNAPVDLRDMNVYSAAQAVPAGEARIVQRTGGPGDEVIVREDVDGVPTFTNLRRGGFDITPRDLQAQADQRVMEDQARRVQEARVRQEEALAENPKAAAQAMKARAEAAGAANTSSQKRYEAMDEELTARFQRARYDDEGQLVGNVEDIQAKQVFIDAMTQLTDEQTGLPMLEAMAQMTPAERADYYAEFERVYADTMLAQRAAAEQGLTASDVLRAGDTGLRRLPNREIGFFDVFGPQATLGDWWAGVGNDDPVLNSYVQDPDSGAVIPARRLTQNRFGGLSSDRLRDFGFLTE